MIVEGNPDGMTLEQVGEVLGVTRERVRQIEVQAFAKLRDSIGFDEFVIQEIIYELQECTTCSILFLKDGSGVEECATCFGSVPEPEAPVETPEVPVVVFMFDLTGWD